MNTRPIESRDVESILEIQSSSPEVAQWTASDYQRAARGEMTGWVAADEGRILGFMVARRTAGDIEILNFAVNPVARRRGIGNTLLRVALDWGAEVNAERALLEVRASNFAALHFYERRGFRVVGRRPRYYVSPVEDALLLTAEIRRAPAISL
ncbi:MAG: ribosomal protein S18-alanine N-acetyltransferase [Acidobacteriota bacterium]|nr:ribosomal protein S18-alanine N-acetyltransferase [Acidobacteriota bacterium]